MRAKAEVKVALASGEAHVAGQREIDPNPAAVPWTTASTGMGERTTAMMAD